MLEKLGELWCFGEVCGGLRLVESCGGWKGVVQACAGWWRIVVPTCISTPLTAHHSPSALHKGCKAEGSLLRAMDAKDGTGMQV